MSGQCQARTSAEHENTTQYVIELLDQACLNTLGHIKKCCSTL